LNALASAVLGAPGTPSDFPEIFSACLKISIYAVLAKKAGGQLPFPGSKAGKMARP
jgi:hypothetical protein